MAVSATLPSQTHSVAAPRRRPVAWTVAATLSVAAAAAGHALSQNEALGPLYVWVLIGGLTFGVLLQRTRFCLLCILKDLVVYRNALPFMAIPVAIGLGGIGYAVVFESWIPDPSQGWLPPQAHIAPVGWHLVLGGLAFGLGMVLSGSCISSHLYRLGEGSLVALPSLAGVVAGFGIGFLTWNTLYVGMIQSAPVVWLPERLGYAGAVGTHVALAAAVAAAGLWWHQRGSAARPRPIQTVRAALRRFMTERWRPTTGGVGVGVLAFVLYFKVEPLGVTAELGRFSRHLFGTRLGVLPDRLEGLDSLAGCSTAAVGDVVTTNAVFIAALVGGSLIAAAAAGHFRVQGFSLRQGLRSAAGGVLLGFGAMISLGCSIGTFLSGTMALSLSGWLFGVAMFAGVLIGLKAMGARAQEVGCSVPSTVLSSSGPSASSDPSATAAVDGGQHVDGTAGLVRVDDLIADGTTVRATASSRRPVETLLVDVGREVVEYEAGHIPGARFFPWHAIYTTVGGIDGELPAPPVVAEEVRRWGIGTDRPVVVYDATGGAQAARLALVLIALGVPSVGLLDGGLHQWVARGRPLETGKPLRTAIDAPLSVPAAWPMTISGDQLAANLATFDILDTRSPEEFSGTDRRADRGGHIPGSKNIDWNMGKDPDTGLLRGSADLERLYGRYLNSTRPLAVLCQSGVRAAHTVYLLRLLGRSTEVYLYDGSWVEWGNRSDLPIDPIDAG